MSEARYNLSINRIETPPVLVTPNGVSDQQIGASIMSANGDSTPLAFNSQSTYVYFIAAGSTPIKIGVSNDPAARLRDLQTAHYQKLHLLYTIECADRAKAFELESAFHRWYGDVHIRNEWFNLTPKKIVEDVRLLSTLAGAVVSTLQHTSSEQLERLEALAEKKASRETNRHNSGAAIQRVIEHLGLHPDDAVLDVRTLGKKIGVGHDTASRGRNRWLALTGQAKEAN